MEITKGLNPLGRIRTTKDKEVESYMNSEVDGHYPLSPVSKLFHEDGTNIHIIAIIGFENIRDVDVFKENLAHVFGKNYRFFSLQVWDKRIKSMKWVPRKLNIDDHVVIPELDPTMKSPDEFVQNFISELSRSRLEKSKPLWDVHILNIKTSDAESTCIFRFHHSLGDGMSLMNLLLASTCKASDNKTLPTLPVKKAASHHIKVTGFKSLFIFLWNTLVAVVMLLLTTLYLKDTQTPLTSSPGIENKPRRFVRTSVSLDDIKMVKNYMDVTVNDVIVGATQAALYSYLNRRYGDNNTSVPENLRLRATLFFNLRASTHVNAAADASRQGTWGNKVGFILLPFNIRPRGDPLDYVRDIKTIMERKKASWEPFFSTLFLGMAIKLFGIKFVAKVIQKIYKSTTLWFSNIPGPQEVISFCGHKVSYLAPTAYGQPTALLIHTVSYVDKVIFVISVEEETIPDPEKLCDDIQHSIHVMRNCVGMV